MSDQEKQNIFPLENLVYPINEKISSKKNSSMPYIGLEHIPSRSSTLLTWSQSDSSSSTNSIFHCGDILFGKLRPNLRKCVTAPFSGYCSTDILVLRNKNGIDPVFAEKILSSEQIGRVAEQTAIGTKMPRTSWHQLKLAKIFLPSIQEQSLIGEGLKNLDTAIQETEAIIEKLKAVKQGLLHDLLTRGIDANGELRPPQSEAPHLYKESPLGWIPKDWDCNLLSESFTVLGGKRLPAGHAYSETSTKFKYLRVTDFFEKSYKTEELKNLQEKTFKALEQYEIKPEQLYISIAGSIGHVGIHRVNPKEDARTIITENAARLIPTSEFNLEFSSAYMNSSSVQNQVSIEKGTGGGVPKLALFRIENFKLAWPCKKEQNVISKKINSVNKRIRHETQYLDKLRLTKSGLMDDLLTGRVRVTPLIDKADATDD